MSTAIGITFPTATKSSVHDIPIRATILSAMSVVPYLLVLAAIFGSDLTAVERGSAVRILFHVIDVFRCPLTAVVIFASNRRQQNRLENVQPIASGSLVDVQTG